MPNKTIWWLRATLLYLGASLGSICAPCQESSTPFTLRSEVRLAQIGVTVNDKRTNAPIEGLTASDFRVLDNDRERSITHFSLVGKDDSPLALVLLVGVDSPSRSVLGSLSKAIREAFAPLRPQDRVAIIGYGLTDQTCRTKMSTASSVAFTRDIEPIAALMERFAVWSQKIRSVCRAERTKDHVSRQEELAAFEQQENMAIQEALRQLDSMPGYRKELIAVSEDLTFVAKDTVESTRQALLREGLSVNLLVRTSAVTGTLKVIMTSSPKEQAKVMAYYAEQTGGLVISPPADGFGKALNDLIYGIQAAYSLTWKVPEADGKFHSVKVALLGDHRGTKIAAPKGYYAVSNAP